MKGHSIMCNAVVEAVCLGTEGEANAEMARRREAHRAEYLRDHREATEQTYAKRFYWRLDEVEVALSSHLRARYVHFKEGGKWYADGVGSFPVDLHLVGRDAWRAAIVQLNGDRMPGLSGDGAEFFTVVIPTDPDGSEGVWTLLAPSEPAA